ncbi:MAG: hypothetical protein ACYDCN_10230 [Bacteroidia bacterium]
MEKKMYKYVVTIDTTVFDNSIEEVIENKSNTIVTEIMNEDPIIARKNAFDKAKSMEIYFEDPLREEPLQLIKFGASFKGEEPLLYILYEIKVAFEIDSKSYCIFADTDTNILGEEVFEGLQKEYETLKKAGINLRGSTELVKYYDCKDKKNKQARILSNGWDWNDLEVNIMHDPSFLDNLDKKKTKKTPKKASKTKSKSDTNFKSTYKHTFNVKKDTIEISLKTTSKIIPTDLEISINKLIQQLVSKK